MKKIRNLLFSILFVGIIALTLTACNVTTNTDTNTNGTTPISETTTETGDNNTGSTIQEGNTGSSENQGTNNPDTNTTTDETHGTDGNTGSSEGTTTPTTDTTTTDGTQTTPTDDTGSTTDGNNTGTTDTQTTNPLDDESVIYDDFRIFFFSVNSSENADLTYIKAGDTDILIDAGCTFSYLDDENLALAYDYDSNSSAKSSDTLENQIIPEIKKYCTDDKFEYVVITNSNEIAGFRYLCYKEYYYNQYYDYLYNYKYFAIDNIINNELTNRTGNVYNSYLNAVNNYVNGQILGVNQKANHYYISDCLNNTNGANSSYQLSDNVTMKFLYNKYHFETTENEGDYSICTLFTYKNGDQEKNFLFTGDLGQKGEEALASYYDGSTPEKTLPKCEFYKAGNHGASDASNSCLLDIIQPEICVVPCCAGSDFDTEVIDEQTPSQAFINRIAKWTDRVYIPTVANYQIAEGYDDDEIEYLEVVRDKYTFEYVRDENGYPIRENGHFVITNEEIIRGYKQMNGNIIISCGTNQSGDLQVNVNCSNNNTKLKDSEWFNATVTLKQRVNGEVVEVTRTVRTKPTEWQ